MTGGGFRGVGPLLPGGKKEKKIWSKLDPLSAIGTKKLDEALFPETPTADPLSLDPSPTPVMAEEIGGTKKKVRKRKRGRGANILAGRLLTKRKQILNTELGGS